MLYYLVAAGIGRLRIIDFDRVELSNLNRQILYTTADIGRNKAAAAAERLGELNGDVAIEAVDAKVEPENIHALLDGYDVVIEGGDSLRGRLVCNAYCLDANVPMVHASAQYNYGYVITACPQPVEAIVSVCPGRTLGVGVSVVGGLGGGCAPVVDVGRAGGDFQGAGRGGVEQADRDRGRAVCVGGVAGATPSRRPGRVSGLFELRRAWPLVWLALGVCSGCSGTVLGGGGCRGCGIRRRVVRRL